MAVAIISRSYKKMIDTLSGNTSFVSCIGYRYQGSGYVNPAQTFFEYSTFDISDYWKKNITKIELVHNISSIVNATGDIFYTGYYDGAETNNSYFSYSKINKLSQVNINSSVVKTHITDFTSVLSKIYDRKSPLVVAGRYTSSSINGGSTSNKYLGINNEVYLHITYDEPICSTTITSTSYPVTPWSSFSVTWKYQTTSAFPADDKQENVQLQYRYSDTATWTEVSGISGSATSYRFGTNYFLEFKNIIIRVRVKGVISEWSNWVTQTITFSSSPPTTNFDFYSEPESPFKDITARWTYTPYFNEDKQLKSHLRYRKEGTTLWHNFTIEGTENRYTIKANTFIDYTNIELQVRVSSTYGGWSDWASYTIEFPKYPPTALNLAPTSKQQPKLPIRLNWAYLNNDQRLVDTQSSSEVAYRKVGSSNWIIETISGTNNIHIIEANTYSIDDKQVEFKVRVAGNYNGFGNWSNVVKFSLQNTPPFAPMLLYPVNSYPKAHEDIYFQWQYSSVLGDSSSESQIQIERNSEIIVDEIIIGSDTSYVYTPEEVSYNYRWRIRCTNSVGEQGGWSSWASFQTLGKPETPTITYVSNESLTLFNFAMVDGLSWKLDIYKGNYLILTSGIMLYSLTYRLLEYLDNGEYTAKLTCYEQNEVSDPYIYNFVIDSKVIFKSELTIGDIAENYIELFFENSTKKALIYRDNKLIGETDTGYYKDIQCLNNTHHTYYVMLIDGYYMAKSNEKIGICYSEKMILASVDNMENHIIPKAVVDLSYKTMLNKTEHTFVGRQLPVVSFDNTTTHTVDVSMVVTNEQLDNLNSLLNNKSLVFMKHRKFGSITGFFTNFDVKIGKHFNTVNLTIKKGGGL